MVPHPVLFNLWKHHAGWVRGRIAGVTPADLAPLAAEVVVIGNALMDVYVGPLSPAEIADVLVDRLRADGRFDPDPYREWLDAGGGYAVLDLPADGSRWTFRLGPVDGRYVHLHPGRYSPNTVRLQATSLKTAVMAHALAAASGRAADDVTVVNEVRTTYLSLPPVPSIAPGGGLAAALTALARRVSER